MATIKVDREYKGTDADHRAFKVFDSKGREVGARVSFYNVTVTELTGNPASYYTVDSAAELGEFFAFCPQATRNGEGFGACQSFRHFRTVAERDAAVAKYFKDAEKRATKAAART